jgi:fatty acid desaturase
MFPMVPYHRLPELHEEMKPYCPPAYPSVAAAYREIIPAILRQAREPGWSIERPLPRMQPAE